MIRQFNYKLASQFSLLGKIWLFEPLFTAVDDPKPWTASSEYSGRRGQRLANDEGPAQIIP